MAKTSALALAALVAITGLALAAPPAQAADIGCGGQTIEVCVPICVTEPCPAYVCVHTPRGPSICQEL